MEIALFVYLASVVGKIVPLFGFTIFLCIVFHIANWFIYHFREIDRGYGLTSKPSVKIYKTFPVLVIVLSILNVLIPSERTMYMMAGGYAAQKVGEVIMESDIQKDMMELISAKIKEEIKQTKANFEK